MEVWNKLSFFEIFLFFCGIAFIYFSGVSGSSLRSQNYTEPFVHGFFASFR